MEHKLAAQSCPELRCADERRRRYSLWAPARRLERRLGKPSNLWWSKSASQAGPCFWVWWKAFG